MLGLEKQEYPKITTIPTREKFESGVHGKIIVITGATTGIGASVARAALEAGAKLVYNLDLKEPSKSQTDEFALLQDDYPNKAHYLFGDVTKLETIKKAFQFIISKEGGVDGVVANAGITKRKGSLEYTEEDWDTIIAVNLKGAVNTCMVAIETFLSLRKTGSIVITASLVAYGTNKAAPALPYQATKSALRGVVRGLASEFGPLGIRVNSVSPGYVNTALTQYKLDDKFPIWGGIPRMAEPREIAGAYVYLLSDAASYTSGEDIRVHGSVDAW